MSLLKKSILAGVLIAPALFPSAAMAQFDMGGGAVSGKKPWAEFKLNPKTRIKLQFRNAGIDSIISLYQETSGVTIVKDPQLVDKLTLTSAKPVGLTDAFQILSTTLSLKGYDIVKEGSLLVIKKKQVAPAAPAFDPSIFATIGQENQNELKVYPVKFASATALSRVLNEVFQSQAGGGFGGFGGGAIQFGGGGGGRFGGGGFNPASLFGAGRNQPNVRASADEFSNSVVVNAPRNQQKDVADLIKQLDKETDAPQRPVVYKLEYASAADVATNVSNVLIANAPKGRGQSSNTNQGGGGFFGALFGGGQANRQQQAQVSPDTRTNSIIVTATDDIHTLVKEIVKQLDSKIQVQTSTFVIPLENAEASAVAGLLNSAFGQRTGINGGNRGGAAGTNRTNTNNNNRNNNNNRVGGATLGGEVIDPNSMALELKDPNADEGELLTRVGVAQGFGFFGGQGGGQQNQNRNTQVARDPNGRVVNIQELQNQVTTIADPNTNSIIVVTTPENAELLRSIVNQLDRIPEQVMIETIIVEATLDNSKKLGFEWNFAQNNVFNQNGATGTASTTFPDAANSVQEGFKYSIVGGALQTTIKAIQTDTRFEVLSTPRIFTSNNVEATINISQSVPYVLSSRQDANGNFTYNYDFKDVGIVLTVTPRITSNGYVTMQVSQTANDLQGYTSFNAPIINQRQADTTVSVKDGETIVLGGIIRNTVNSTVRKVPLLGDIPLLGELFKSTSKTKNKTELLVFLTPRVVRDPDDARMLRQKQQNQLSDGSLKELKKVIPPSGAGVTPPPTNTGGGTKGNGGKS